MLRDPSISFFLDYLERMGPKLPPAAYGAGESQRTRDAKSNIMEESDEDLDNEDIHGQGTTHEEHESDDEIMESDVELEGETVEPYNDPPQKV